MLGVEWFLIILFISFILELMDSTLGMGYGTTLTPVLLLLGFHPIEIIPSILIAGPVCGIVAAYFHHSVGNVKFDFSNDKAKKVKILGKNIYIPKSRPAKIVILLSILGFIGVLMAVFIVMTVPEYYIKLYIGLLVIAMGFLIIARRKLREKFSWVKLSLLGILASFNKGISGGGYGPIIVSGQILSGVNSKMAIPITLLAEAIICLFGVVFYFSFTSAVNWMLTLPLIIGGVLSAYPSALIVKRTKTKNMLLFVGLITILLGLITLAKIFL